MATETLPETPPGHLLQWRQDKDLFDVFWHSYQSSGSISTLEECVQILERCHSTLLLPQSERRLICERLCVTLHDLYKQTKNIKHLDKAISIAREAKSLRPHSLPERAMTLNKLAFMLVDRYQAVRDLEALNEAIKLLEEALTLLPENHPNRLATYDNLATFLTFTGKPGLLAIAMKHARKAVDECQISDPQRGGFNQTLAQIVFIARHHLSRSPPASDANIELLRQLVDLWPPDHEDRAAACSSLVDMLLNMYAENDGVDHDRLEEAVKVCQDALVDIVNCPIVYQGRLCKALAYALWEMHLFTGDVTLLKEVVDRGRVALMLLGDSESPDDRSAGLTRMLSSWLIFLFQHTKDSTLLDEAIELSQTYLSLFTPEHPGRTGACYVACHALRKKYDCTGQLHALDKRIELLREELAICPSESRSHRTAVLVYLSDTLLQRWADEKDFALLAEAHELARNAISLEPEGMAAVDSLARVLLWMGVDTNNPPLFEEGVSMMRRAIEKCPPDAVFERTRSYTNLSSALSSQYHGDSRKLKNLEEAIAIVRQGISEISQVKGNEEALVSLLSVLARNLHHYALHQGEHGDTQEVLAICDDALAILATYQAIGWHGRIYCLKLNVRLSMPAERLSLPLVKEAVNDLRLYLQDLKDNYSYAMVAEIAECLVDIWKKHTPRDVLAALYPVYKELYRILPLLSQYSLDHHQRLHAFTWYHKLGASAFTCAWAAGESLAGLEFFEQTQGHLWSEALQTRDAQVDALPEALGSELRMLLTSFDTASISHEGKALKPLENHPEPWLTNADLRRRKAARVTQILKEVRNTPGLEHFLLGPNCTSIRKVASDNHPLVILIEGNSKSHHFAVLLRSEEREIDVLTFKLDVSKLSLENFSGGQARSHRAEDTDLGASQTDRGLRMTGKKDQSLTILENLWKVVVKPILERLEIHKPNSSDMRPRLHWFTTNAFAFLPIHAAGVYSGPLQTQECCSDYVVSSYTPTISALLRARKSNTKISSQGLRLLLTADAEGGRTHGLTPIWGVDSEVESIRNIARANGRNVTSQQTGHTSVEQVVQELPETHVLHLACHGVQDPYDPLESGFYLANERLTISKLMEVKLGHPFLAFLSACETAQGDRIQAHQSMHLASAMLFAGFKSVIATMWSISDDDGPLVARAFYQDILARDEIDIDVIAFAIDAAVTKLRHTGAEPKRWAPFVHFGA